MKYKSDETQDYDLEVLRRGLVSIELNIKNIQQALSSELNPNNINVWLDELIKEQKKKTEYENFIAHAIEKHDDSSNRY